jgi:GNAT superfamily N-acetyltransferase
MYSNISIAKYRYAWFNINMPKRDGAYEIPDVRAPQIHGALTANKLMKQRISGVIGRSITMKDQCLDLSLGCNNYIAGDITELEGKTVALIHQIYVSRLLREKGIGERLLKTFVSEAKVHGAEELWSDNVSNMALSLRARTFGIAALQFYDSDNPELGFLPMTYDQARSVNDLILSTLNSDDGEPVCGDIGVYVNLRDVDTSQWPRAEDLAIADLSILVKS